MFVQFEDEVGHCEGMFTDSRATGWRVCGEREMEKNDNFSIKYIRYRN